MTWFAQAANEAEAAKYNYALIVAVDMDFPSGHQRYWSGVGQLTINGQVYTGAGALVSISTPEEHTTLVAERKTYQLSGVSLSLVSEADIDASYGRSVTEYFGFLHSETLQLLATPEINWEGRIDAIRRQDGATPLIQVDAEHRVAVLEQSDDWRFTNEHQQQFFAGDIGFRELPDNELLTCYWGGKLTRPGASQVYKPFLGTTITDYGKTGASR